MSQALVLVDIQKDYFPGGKMEVAGAVEAAGAAERLLGYVRGKNLPVFHIQHVSARAGATFFLPNTEGINFYESVIPRSDEVVVKKHFPNSFRDTNLQDYLVRRGIKDIIICGMMSHMCIDATVRAAFDRGYACTVAHDACATRNLIFNGTGIPAMHVHGAFMASLCSVYAKVLSVEEIIECLNQSGL